MARRGLVLISAMVFWTVQGAMAQSPTELRPGDRLRVRVLDGPVVSGFRPETTTYVGRLAAFETARLGLSVDDSLPPEVFDLERVIGIERSLGRPMPAVAAWLTGAALGGGLAWYSGVGIGGGGAVLGLSVLVGGGAGLLLAREDWRILPLPSPK